MITLNEIPNYNDIDISILRDALNEKTSGNIDQMEFMSIILSWSYHHVFVRGEFYPIKKPNKPPHVERYDKLPFEERKTVRQDIKDRVKDDRLIWLNDIAKAEHENDSNRDWLERMLAYYAYKKDQNIECEINNRILLYTEKGRSGLI